MNRFAAVPAGSVGGGHGRTEHRSPCKVTKNNKFPAETYVCSSRKNQFQYVVVNSFHLFIRIVKLYAMVNIHRKLLNSSSSSQNEHHTDSDT